MTEFIYIPCTTWFALNGVAMFLQKKKMGPLLFEGPHLSPSKLEEEFFKHMSSSGNFGPLLFLRKLIGNHEHPRDHMITNFIKTSFCHLVEL